ncbi:hypothetical protein [Clostridium manihotivorum]|uniref:Uncharacterized protein n=1 Tax=Clostridium manihotivorum TaxID=2320868 RepID=A0A410DRF1_9CLOT|nr:hypothetical protein [Clostridium manihotivorum]QAA31615.1 hypothetical protein C1I91_08135 [Clostridium manihotivorum]
MNSKKLYVINSNGEVFYITSKNSELELFNSNFHKTLHQNVKAFEVKYDTTSIFILFHTFASKLGLIKINLSQMNELNITWIEANNFSFENINCLSMEILDNLIHFFYSKANLNDTITYIYHGIVSNSCQIYELCKINCYKYVRQFYTAILDNKVIMLICEDNKESLYSLRIIDESFFAAIRYFNLPGAFSLNVITSEDQIELFYNKIVERDIFLFHKSINIIRDKFLFSEESLIKLKETVQKPLISFYKNKFYICWNRKDRVYITNSEDLRNWPATFSFDIKHNIPGVILINNTSMEVFTCFLCKRLSTKASINELPKVKEVPVKEVEVIKGMKKNDRLINYLLSTINTLSLKYIKLLHEKNFEIDNLKATLSENNKKFERKITSLMNFNNRTVRYYEGLIANLLNITLEKDSIIEDLQKLNNKNNEDFK